MRYAIHVRAEAETVSWRGLFPLLEGVLPVRFICSTALECEGAGEIILHKGERPIGRNARIPSLEVPGGENVSARGDLLETVVRFADDTDAPFPFRARTLQTRVATEPELIAPGDGHRVLACTDRGPVWTVSLEDGVKHFESGFRPPGVGSEACLKDVLNGERFLELLPLLHWLREICAGSAFEGPPLRACFMFDDPNLHWPRYGCLDFRQIAAHSAKENYHVSFATIPLDAWFTHKGTVKLFAGNADRLSLLVHGNNHTYCELARDYSESERLALLRQAIHRIEGFESLTGLQVSRVMVAPGGACSEAMLAELPRCGFEAACISHGSLESFNKGRPWTSTLGYAPAELIGDCPVLPRWGFAGATTNAILLAAFLRQAIIIRGHQQDLRDGIELLNHHGRFINSLGPVRWSNITEISRASYQWRMNGNACTIRPLGRRVTCRVPRHARRLMIERPSTAFPESWQVSGLDGPTVTSPAGECVSLPETFGGELSLSAVPETGAPSRNGRYRPSTVAFLRRLLTEGRDRLLPV